MKQFVVIGLGRFGVSVATELYRMGHEVLAIDRSVERVEEIADSVTHAVCADATDEAELGSLGLRNFDVAVVSIGSDLQASILVTMLCKELGVKYVLTKAKSDLHAKVLQRVGADKVVFPERDMGARTAYNLVSTNILDYIELSPDYSLVEISVPPQWVGKNMRELNLRLYVYLFVMAIRHVGGDISVAPQGIDAPGEGRRARGHRLQCEHLQAGGHGRPVSAGRAALTPVDADDLDVLVEGLDDLLRGLSVGCHLIGAHWDMPTPWP